ncbi:NgoPII family restriction endonuclease [Flavobacterium macrobrachii]|uniref:NgoPII family restriction endonuclease n=1 Tax=Flavobacterium macrobrachii TaxID=591204 RepID=A0ABS2CUV8_9FLAO|nr:NgoPII family restriction endonuclease [Flavobacterium macrobrachii]MBM6498012.1 NgoPII family restriction endonuclease [Flavobacterium macrobrachii]MBS1641586.1 NgoPII family restriction endonuclease [Bacteroidota bacterium]
MTNILEAIVNIAENPIYEIRNHYSGRNRMNNVGEALETFIKDAFANTIQTENKTEKMRRYNEEFSWLGNQNHPPDIMIKGGDAIEVKKTQSANSDLALNSSYPKSTVQANSTMITQACRTCEDWTEKDLIYCVGHTTDDSIKSLWMVYGNIYAATHETYQIIKQKITEGINEIPNVELAETNELGRVNRVDPLGITNLRIRGMWQIQNPRRVFNYLHTSTNLFEVVTVIPTKKYDSFSKESKKKLENLGNPNLTIDNVEVKDPNNPANLIEAKLIIFKVIE